MSDMQCPYCGADQEVCHDDGHGYAEGVKWEHTCSACEKTFVFETSIVMYYYAAKADCLNGDDHAYKATSTFPVSATQMECIHCGHRRKPTPEEMDAVIAEHESTKGQP